MHVLSGSQMSQWLTVQESGQLMGLAVVSFSHTHDPYWVKKAPLQHAVHLLALRPSQLRHDGSHVSEQELPNGQRP